MSSEKDCSPIVNEFMSSLEQDARNLGIALSRRPTVSVSQIPEDLQDVKTNIQNITIKYDMIAAFQEANDSEMNVQQATFSTLTWKQLKGIGVSRSVIPLSRFINAIDHSMKHTVNKQRLSEVFASFWCDKKDHIVNILTDVIELYGRPSEALARVLIDRIVTELCLFLKRRLSCIPFILVELTVGSLCYKPAIIENKTTNNALGLTGRLDYTLLTLLLGPTDLANSLGLENLEVERGIEAIPKQISLDALLEIPWISKVANDTNYLNFTTVEAKTRGKALKSYEKHVVGQQLAVMEKTGQVFKFIYYNVLQLESRRSRMQWCITNGVEWLFGILRKQGEGFESIRIDEPIAFDLSLKDTSNIELIMKCMVFWAYNSEKSIDRVFNYCM